MKPHVLFNLLMITLLPGLLMAKNPDSKVHYKTEREKNHSENI
jgi:hypothetical protein